MRGASPSQGAPELPTNSIDLLSNIMNSNGERIDLEYDGSIIVPAHNEETRIGLLLPVLSRAAQELRYLVVVSCNGCTDNTEAMARSAPGIHVTATSEVSKSLALNEGEQLAGDVFPRLYIDADVITGLEDLRVLMNALRVDEPIAVRPSAYFMTANCSWLVRTFVEAQYLIPSSRKQRLDHLQGQGIYGTNRRGRQKFSSFPRLIADDTFFDSMFDLSEKRLVEGARVDLASPRFFLELFRVLTRVFVGNMELERWLTEERPDRLQSETSRPSEEHLSWTCIRSYCKRTFDSWHPAKVFPVLLHLVILRAVMLRARYLYSRRETIPWR